MHKKVMLLLVISMILSACSALAPNSSGTLIEDELVGLEVDPSNSDQVSESLPVMESEGENPTVTEPEEVSYSMPEPNPIDLTIQIDDQQSNEAEIGPQGGTLELASPDGSRFILEIPPGALLSPETIQMTAIASIDGLPFEDQGVMAVNLQPTGLVFFEMVRLRIIDSSLNGEALVLGFGTQSSGEDFHLQPSLRDEQEVELLIFHFSNYGIAKATRAVLEHIKDRYSSSRASNYAKNEISLIKEGESDQASQLEAYEIIMKEWLYRSILPSIENGNIFFDDPDYVLGEFIEWNGVIDVVDLLWGFDGQLRERLAAEIEIVLNALAKRVAQLMEEAYELCIIDKEPEEALRMYRWGLAATALNLWDRSNLDMYTLEGKFFHCFAFEFELYSEVNSRVDEFHTQIIVDARIPLTIDRFNFWDVTLSHQPVITLDWKINPSIQECQLSSVNGQLAVEINFMLNYNIYDAWQIAGVDAILKLMEHPKEIATCKYGDDSVVTETELWAIVFQRANQQLFHGEEIHVNLPIDRYLDYYAVFFTENEMENGSIKEFSRFSLFHKP
jgi:hypothetical protein